MVGGWFHSRKTAYRYTHKPPTTHKTGGNLDIIQTTDGITRTIYLLTLPSGNAAAIEAHATFGELAVFLALILVAALLAVVLVKLWKH